MQDLNICISIEEKHIYLVTYDIFGALIDPDPFHLTRNRIQPQSFW